MADAPLGLRGRPIQAMSTNFMIGAHFEGRYRIDAEIGAGGVGAVYRAVHLKLGRAVALKVLQEKYGASNELRHRFEREAKALAALSHPNIVTVTDYGIAGGVPYLVMELLEGKTLDERLHGGEGVLETADAFDIARQILKALSFVHEQGLVHRDMKPGNIFLQQVPASKPHVKVLDFGLAKFLATEGQETALTRAGQVFGTPSYMAPEQVAGQETDARTDVYAVGVILFEMLSGRKPFEGNASEVMRKHLVESLPALHEVAPHRREDPALDALLRRATAKLQKDRYPSALSLSQALDELPAATGAGGKATRGRPEAPTVATFSAAATKDEALGQLSAAPRPSLLPRGVSPARTALYAALPLAAILGLSALMHTLQQQNQAPSQKGAEEKPATKTNVGTNTALGSPSKKPGGALQPSAGTTPASTAVEKPIEPGPLPSSTPVGEVFQPPAPGSPISPMPDPARVWKNAPKLLVGSRDAVRAGTPLSRRTLNYLHEYNSKNPGDPRGHLLLARAYMNRGWRKDALNEYAVAYKLNPEVRGEPKMLADLVDLVAHGSTMAGDLIRSAYGTHALGEIERAMDDAAPNREMVGRLEELRDGLRG